MSMPIASKLPLKLLVLEDQADSREATELLLKSEGFDVISTSSGESAVEAVKDCTTPFYAMIMDIRMDGGMDGLQAAKEIQQNLNRNIPALILSAFNNPEHQAQADRLDLSIRGWVGKPDLENQTMVYLNQLADEAHSVDQTIAAAFKAFTDSTNAGLRILRAFLQQKADYDPFLIPYILNQISKAETAGRAEEFITQVNFLTFEAQAQKLLEKYHEGFVAFWKGAFSGYAPDEEKLIRDVYRKKKTTDFFVARLHPGIKQLPAGNTVRFRRQDGFIQ